LWVGAVKNSVHIITDSLFDVSYRFPTRGSLHKAGMKNLIFAISILVIFSSCRSTELIGSWKREDMPSKSYHDVGIIVMTPNMSSRSIVESDLSTILVQKGIRAIPTFDIFPFAAKQELFEEVDEEEMQAHVRERVNKFEFNALLIITILDQETETRYNQGASFSMAVPAYQYNYYGYYHWAYATVSAPGYYSTKTTYFLESNLYDVETEALIWTAQTKTKKDANSIQKESKVFANILAQEITKKKVL
jgi:hypothetical protein